MKKYRFLIVLSIAAVVISCGNDKKKSDLEVKTVNTSPEKVEHASATLEAEFNDSKIARVYQQYNNLKTSLVNTNPENASVAAADLLKAYSNIGVDEEVFATATTIAESNDIEEQRKAFEVVTAQIELILEGAIKSGTIYKQYCPMAFNNKGAYWLSNSKEIRNPYFGDKMLKCGRIDSEIK